MASKRYKKLFLIRFLAYFFAITGTLSILFAFGPILLSELSFRKDQLLDIHYVVTPQVASSTPSPKSSGGTGFAQGFGTESIVPVSTDFGIVIEKINANSKVIADVDPGNQAQYTQALSEGVAEAKGSTSPGQPGNLYIFSHSTDAPWDVIRYNAVFYLLRELEPGDKVLIFYKGRRYDYIVYDKAVVPPNNLTFLNNRYNKPVLTLQTCDPPGTLINRLIVRAQLENS